MRKERKPAIKKEMADIDITDILDLREQIFYNTDPEELYEQYELNRQIKKLLITLTPREEKALRLYFYENRNLTEIGNEFYVTGGRIGNLIAKAIRKCKHPTRAKMIEDFT